MKSEFLFIYAKDRKIIAMDLDDETNNAYKRPKGHKHTATLDAVLFLKDLLQSDSDEEIINKINELRK